MRMISQRELRNDNAEILRGVEAGESYTVTRRGVPVAKIGPLDDHHDLRCARPARRSLDFLAIDRVVLPTTTRQLLDDDRGDR